MTASTQELALARLRRLYQLNPLGSNLMMGPALFLLALEYGAGDLAMGVLYAGGYLAGGVAVFAPWLCARIDPARLTILAWWGRAWCGAPYLLLPFLASPVAKVVLLVACFMGFAAVRMVGIIALNVATTAYVDVGRRPRLIAYAHVWYNVGVLGGTLLTTALLFWHTGEAGYLSVLILGVLATFAAAHELRGLPAVGMRHERMRPLPWGDHGVREAMRTTALVVPQAVAAAYQVSSLRSVQELSSGMIVALTVVGVLGAILATRWLTRSLPRFGLKRVQIGVHAALVVVGLAWAFSGIVPEQARTWTCMALYVASQPLLAMSLALMSAIQVDRLPPRGVVGASAIIQATGALGGAVGVFLIWLSAGWGLERLPGAGAYAHAFLLWAACSLTICIMGRVAGRAPTAVDGLQAVNERE